MMTSWLDRNANFAVTDLGKARQLYFFVYIWTDIVTDDTGFITYIESRDM